MVPQAAEGNHERMLELGRIYLKEGTSQDIPEAIKWLKMAADRSNADAAAELEVLYNKFPEIKDSESGSGNWIEDIIRNTIKDKLVEIVKNKI